MGEDKRAAAESLIESFMAHPDLLFTLAKAANHIAGPWQKRKDSRQMEEWVRLSPRGSTIGRVWIETSGGGHWRGMTADSRHIAGKTAEDLKRRVDGMLTQGGWSLVE